MLGEQTVLSCNWCSFFYATGWWYGCSVPGSCAFSHSKVEVLESLKGLSMMWKMRDL